jgi:hypothetical protein
MTQEQKQWMLKAIKNAEPQAIFQHEVDALKVMYSKYIDTEPSQDEIKDDINFLNKLS